MGATAICEYLEWDSQFFGRRIARANISCLTKSSASEIDSWCGAHEIECLYFLASFSDHENVKIAQENMFRLVDVRVTLDLDLSTAKANVDATCPRVRNAVESDIPALRAIARTAHRDSRFYYDEEFPNHLCDELYETWIETSCHGWSANVFVAGEGKDIAGYLTCHLPDRSNGQIGLVGVASNAQGKGIGSDLVSHAVRWFAQEGVEKVSVVTQGRNVRAQRLYQRRGFVTRSVDLWFHRWFSEGRKSE